MILLVTMCIAVLVTYLISGSTLYKEQRKKGNSWVGAFIRSVILLMPF